MRGLNSPEFPPAGQHPDLQHYWIKVAEHADEHEDQRHHPSTGNACPDSGDDVKQQCPRVPSGGRLDGPWVPDCPVCVRFTGLQVAQRDDQPVPADYGEEGVEEGEGEASISVVRERQTIPQRARDVASSAITGFQLLWERIFWLITIFI